MSNLPRLLIVSEATLSLNGKGVNRTLANLFDNYPSDRLMIFAPAEQMRNEPTAPQWQQQSCSFREHYISPLRNRFGFLVKSFINFINLQLLDWLPIPNKVKIAKFAPEAILICPITPLCLLMGWKISKQFQCPFLIYFMDDWVADDNTRWLSGSVQNVTAQLLRNSTGWLMISEQLQESLVSRYQVTPKNSIIVHNPVELLEQYAPDFNVIEGEPFRVVYAGSIWQMHYDAVAVMAEAIFQLRTEGKAIELILHTDQSFWDWYKEKWELWQVTNGDFIPYEKLNNALIKADLLLVASSFLPDYYHMTQCSVQTKITDYMASGRPILSCGPTYSACNQFVKKWNCGLVCETNNVSEVKLFVAELMENRDKNQRYAKVAYDVLKQNFEKNKVSSELYQWISKTTLKTSKEITRI
ncbi:hypothetical protein H6G41_28170 [Tolypothrix sp. FACHB-123]|uniref:glycosyltransferase n=1 Tax=Tolypothrix sp. FACHB-123 TaxID=2692868 RepID=UPI0016871115|nr:glycosyltransferase [Tolypothrix sp. FACHB-123]MBD2358441.1 hypothetical protein [Tolypothrix sp. FACHB-123]